MRRILLTVILVLAGTKFVSAKRDICDACFQAGVNAFAICSAGGGDYNTCHQANMNAACACYLVNLCGDGIALSCSGGPN